jgi:hypothetical protein
MNSAEDINEQAIKKVKEWLNKLSEINSEVIYPDEDYDKRQTPDK